MTTTATKLPSRSAAAERHRLFFLCSAFLFRMGLALMTFEQDRFLTLQFSDYLFFLSLSLLLLSSMSRSVRSMLSGVPLGGVLILAGALLSLLNASSINDATGPLARLFVLFALFAPLAVIHSKDIRANMRFLAAGISANCAVALIQASVFPGIVDILSINPAEQTDYGTSIGRFIGLTSHPNVLGLSAALGIFIGVGLFFLETSLYVRCWLVIQVSVCTVGALLSGSRTALVSLVPALLVFGLFQRKNRRAIVRTVGALAVSWLALTYLAPDALPQYSERIDSEGLVDYNRLLTASAAIADISQKPILGWGADRFGQAGMMLLEDTADVGEVGGAHLTFLQYWYAVGLLGAIGFLVLFGIPAVQMLRALRGKLSPDSRNALSLGLGVYVLLLIISNLQPVIYNRFQYVPLFVFAGFAARVLGPMRAHRIAHELAAHLRTPSLRHSS